MEAAEKKLQYVNSFISMVKIGSNSSLELLALEEIKILADLMKLLAVPDIADSKQVDQHQENNADLNDFSSRNILQSELPRSSILEFFKLLSEVEENIKTLLKVRGKEDNFSNFPCYGISASSVHPLDVDLPYNEKFQNPFSLSAFPFADEKLESTNNQMNEHSSQSTEQVSDYSTTVVVEHRAEERMCSPSESQSGSTTVGENPEEDPAEMVVKWV